MKPIVSIIMGSTSDLPIAIFHVLKCVFLIFRDFKFSRHIPGPSLCISHFSRGHQQLYPLGDNLLQQGGQVLIVVVEGIAVDAAGLHNVLYGNLVQGALVQQCDKGLLNRFSGKIRACSLWRIAAL